MCVASPSTPPPFFCRPSRRCAQNQRFSLLNPEEEKYAAEIETAVYNALLKNLVKRGEAGRVTEPRRDISRGTTEQRAAAMASQLEADAESGATPPLCTKDCKMVP